MKVNTPITTTWEADGLYRKIAGHISGDQILTSNFEIQSDPRFKKISYLINDMTEITDHDIDPIYLQTYAQTDELLIKTKRPKKLAIVVATDEQLQLAELYKSLVSKKAFDIHLFYNLDSARNWVK